MFFRDKSLTVDELLDHHEIRRLMIKCRLKQFEDERQGCVALLETVGLLSLVRVRELWSSAAKGSV